LKAVHHISVSSAATRRAFNSGFDAVNLHRPTTVLYTARGLRASVQTLAAAQVEIESKV
jgi:hypothetical protein